MKGSERPPEAIVATLLAGRDDPHDERKNATLLMVTERLLAVAVRHYPWLGDECRDVVQQAVAVIARPERLQSIHDPRLFWHWAHGVLHQTIRTARRSTARRRRIIASWPGKAGDADRWVERLPASPALDPESIALNRELLRKVFDEILSDRSPIGRLRLLEDLDEETVCLEQGCTRDVAAGKVKRLRARLRALRRDS